MSYPVRLAPALLALVLSAAACGGSTSSTEGTTAPTPPVAQAPAGTTIAAVAPQATGHARMVADALSSVPLRDDQRAQIEKMAADSETRHQVVAAAHGQVATLLAAQIESGTLDRAALQPAIDAAVTAASASHPADHAAMEQLHTMLTPEQRGQFVDALEANGKAHHAAHTMGSHKARLEEWATDLKLTDDQCAQIAAILKSAHSSGHHEDFHAPHAAGMGFMESFRGDTLAPAAPPPDAEMRTRANEHADKLVAIVQQVLPLLTPEQRSLAAAKIRAHADALEPMGPPSE